MSTIHYRSSNLQFELKLIQLKQLLDHASPSATTQIPITFDNLVQEIVRNKQPAKLFTLLDRNLPKSCETKSSLEFTFLALKSVQYGLSETSNQGYKSKWKDLTDDQLKIKIEKLQEKVDKLKETYTPVSNLSANTELPKVVTTTPSTPDNKESELFHSIKGSLSKATSKIFRKVSFSGSSSIGSKTSTPPPARKHVETIFTDPNKEQGVLETTLNKNEVSPSKKEKEEVYFWESGVLSNLPLNPPQVLVDFKENLLNAIHKDPSVIMLSNSCKDEKEQALFLETLSTYIDEVLFRVEKNLTLFDKDINSQKAVTKEIFVTYSFLLNLYYVSLELDKVYYERKWLKPKLLDNMQDLLHFKKQLDGLAPKIKEIPCLKPVWLEKRDFEVKLAYAYLCSINKWFTRVAFERDYADKIDPLKASGLGHRKSVDEVPKGINSILNIQKS